MGVLVNPYFFTSLFQFPQDVANEDFNLFGVYACLAPLFLALLCLAPTSIWRRSNIPHAPRGAPVLIFYPCNLP